MRPINLIPPEQRRGSQASLRSGPLAYILVGALVLALAGVAALVLTGKQVSDREADLAELRAEDAQASAKAERLSPFTQFRNLREQRVATVSSLADSRFDWERVMRELSLVLPDDAWLVSLTATASPEVTIEAGGAGSTGSDLALRDSAPGPALELTGCASGQDSVAGFVAALRDIDGVTRVGVVSSELPDSDSGAGSPESDKGGGSEDCRTRDFIAKFEIVVAFDAAPIPIVGSAQGTPVAPAPEEAPAEEEGEAQPASNESPEGG
jgi:Tfp pilus assembly protein PilN